MKNHDEPMVAPQEPIVKPGVEPDITEPETPFSPSIQPDTTPKG